jgi:glycosyltransferase involved in cell wall biosynthesis
VGVGASQVLPYVERLAQRGVRVRLHTFESSEQSAATTARLCDAGIDWRPHPFRRGGPAMGAVRVLQGARWIRNASLVHARSDLAAASALLARSPRWVWDVRSFWIDQRIAMGAVRPRSQAERVLRYVERRAASKSSAIVTLTAAAVDELRCRHGDDVAEKATVVPTCVDLIRFRLRAIPAGPVRLLLSGTFNALYDIDEAFRFAGAVAELTPALLDLVRPYAGPLDRRVRDQGGRVQALRFEEMPTAVNESHAGLVLCRTDYPAAIIGAMPTKIGEFLATGRPVVVNKGLGDMDALAAEHRCAVVVGDRSEDAIGQAARELVSLLEDPDTPARCRATAEQHFDLDAGADRLVELYSRIAKD